MTKKMRRLFVVLALLFCTTARAQSQSVTIQYGINVGAAHQVQVAWVASLTIGVSSYNVYRSTTNGSGYVKIGSVTAPVVTFADTTNIVNGTTYYYVITSVSTGGESAFSNPSAVAVIPSS